MFDLRVLRWPRAGVPGLPRLSTGKHLNKGILYSVHCIFGSSTIYLWSAVCTLQHTEQGFGAGAAQSRGIWLELEPSLWAGSGSTFNICLIIHANSMKLDLIWCLFSSKHKLWTTCIGTCVRTYFRQFVVSLKNSNIMYSFTRSRSRHRVENSWSRSRSCPKTDRLRNPDTEANFSVC